jgi:hypothetical protein
MRGILYEKSLICSNGEFRCVLGTRRRNIHCCQIKVWNFGRAGAVLHANAYLEEELRNSAKGLVIP